MEVDATGEPEAEATFHALDLLEVFEDTGMIVEEGDMAVHPEDMAPGSNVSAALVALHAEVKAGLHSRAAWTTQARSLVESWYASGVQRAGCDGSDKAGFYRGRMRKPCRDDQWDECVRPARTVRPWPAKRIPYRFAASCDESMKKKMRMAVEWWERSTCIRFEENGAANRRAARRPSASMTTVGQVT